MAATVLLAITAAPATAPAEQSSTPSVQQEARDIQIGRNWKTAWPVVHYLQQVHVAELARAEAARQAVLRKREPERSTRPSAPAARPRQSESQAGSGRCGGDLPPCYVMMRESRGSLTAENPVSTASGKWQFLDSTWNGYGGYSHAADAPESVQDARAKEVWNGGAGCSNWSAC